MIECKYNKFPEKRFLWCQLPQQAIHSFPNGSAGGPDGLKPQYDWDISRRCRAGASDRPYAPHQPKLVLEGKTPISIRPFFLGAPLVALECLNCIHQDTRYQNSFPLSTQHIVHYLPSLILGRKAPTVL